MDVNATRASRNEVPLPVAREVFSTVFVDHGQRLFGNKMVSVDLIAIVFAR